MKLAHVRAPVRVCLAVAAPFVCAVCTFQNPGGKLFCDMCQTPRPGFVMPVRRSGPSVCVNQLGGVFSPHTTCGHRPLCLAPQWRLAWFVHTRDPLITKMETMTTTAARRVTTSLVTMTVTSQATTASREVRTRGGAACLAAAPPRCCPPRHAKSLYCREEAPVWASPGCAPLVLGVVVWRLGCCLGRRCSSCPCSVFCAATCFPWTTVITGSLLLLLQLWQSRGRALCAPLRTTARHGRVTRAGHLGRRGASWYLAATSPWLLCFTACFVSFDVLSVQVVCYVKTPLRGAGRQSSCVCCTLLARRRRPRNAIV